jgi:hypothetical protein
VPAEVHAITSAKVFPQLQDAIADGFTISENPRFQAPQANAHFGLRLFVPNGLKPFRERLSTIAGLISEDLKHRRLV